MQISGPQDPGHSDSAVARISSNIFLFFTLVSLLLLSPFVVTLFGDIFFSVTAH